VAILAGFIASAAVFAINRRDRVMGLLMLFGFVIVALTALIGIVWDSEKAYLASGPISDFAFVPLYALSIVARRPLIGLIARELFPAWGRAIPVNDRVFIGLSLAWAAYDLLHGLLRAWLLAELSVTEYIFISRLVSWPFSAALLGVSVRSIRRASRRSVMQVQPAAAEVRSAPA
jgi:hypothetical protein